MIKDIDRKIALEYLEANPDLKLSPADSEMLDRYISYHTRFCHTPDYESSQGVDRIFYYFQQKNLNAFNLSILRKMEMI